MSILCSLCLVLRIRAAIATELKKQKPIAWLGSA